MWEPAIFRPALGPLAQAAYPASLGLLNRLLAYEAVLPVERCMAAKGAEGAPLVVHRLGKPGPATRDTTHMAQGLGHRPMPIGQRHKSLLRAIFQRSAFKPPYLVGGTPIHGASPKAIALRPTALSEVISRSAKA
jgi:hypothetical protein